MTNALVSGASFTLAVALNCSASNCDHARTLFGVESQTVCGRLLSKTHQPLLETP